MNETKNKTKYITIHIGDISLILEYGEKTVLIDIDNKTLEDINCYVGSGCVKARVRGNKEYY